MIPTHTRLAFGWLYCNRSVCVDLKISIQNFWKLLGTRDFGNTQCTSNYIRSIIRASKSFNDECLLRHNLPSFLNGIRGQFLTASCNDETNIYAMSGRNIAIDIIDLTQMYAQRYVVIIVTEYCFNDCQRYIYIFHTASPFQQWHKDTGNRAAPWQSRASLSSWSWALLTRHTSRQVSSDLEDRMRESSAQDVGRATSV